MVVIIIKLFIINYFNLFSIVVFKYIIFFKVVIKLKIIIIININYLIIKLFTHIMVI